MYVVSGQIVSGPLEVVEALGDEAKVLLDRLEDPDLVLERLGRAY
jgi:hypothetical protein